MPRSISEPLWKCKYHKKSCRSIQVADDGQFLVSGGKDLQLHLLDLNQEKTLFSISKAHPLVSAYMNAFTPCLIFRHAINRVLWADQHLIASGDDEGMLRVSYCVLFTLQIILKRYGINVNFQNIYSNSKNMKTLFLIWTTLRPKRHSFLLGNFTEPFCIYRLNFD